MAIIESIYETMNLRIQETAFELHLRKIYPTRNILSFRETETISGPPGLDVQKKTDRRRKHHPERLLPMRLLLG